MNYSPKNRAQKWLLALASAALIPFALGAHAQSVSYLKLAAWDGTASVEDQHGRFVRIVAAGDSSDEALHRVEDKVWFSGRTGLNLVIQHTPGLGDLELHNLKQAHDGTRHGFFSSIIPAPDIPHRVYYSTPGSKHVRIDYDDLQSRHIAVLMHDDKKGRIRGWVLADAVIHFNLDQYKHTQKLLAEQEARRQQEQLRRQQQKLQRQQEKLQRKEERLQRKQATEQARNCAPPETRDVVFEICDD